jgi:hypothetical protein
MRYNNVATVVFKALNGVSYSIKDLRDIPIYTTRKTIEYKGEALDEVASRFEVFGEFMEDQTYRIFESNLTDIFDKRLNFDKVRRLKIPI